MSEEEARALKVGDAVHINDLRVTVEGVEETPDGVFICTRYGNFASHVCRKVEGATQ